MRNLVLLFSALVLGTSATFATIADTKVAERNAYRYNNSFIFVEEGITFAVYPDGEFDFYIDNMVSGRRNNITFNSGFDYSPFAQYDDYGAVIQVENIPIFYDFYGRVTQVGGVDINYRNGRVNRLGNMYVFYNRNGFYDYHTGFINVYNRNYIYRPFHSFFVRPSLGFCLVFNAPYRRYYNPIRYTYYSPYRYNVRHAYATVGKTHRYNEVRRERETIYRNDNRVAVREHRTSARDTNGAVSRSNRTVAKRDGISTSNRTSRNTDVALSNRSTSVERTTMQRSDYKRTTVGTTNGERTVKRTVSATASPQRTTVTKRTVTQTPTSRSAAVQRTSQKPAERTTVVRSSSSQRTVSKAPASTRNTAARSTSSASSRSTGTAASSRSSRVRQ